jgi:multidrug efflux pump subunit AcrB
MKTVPGVVDLDSSMPAPLPETTLRPNLDHAAALGVDPGDMTSTLGVLMGGVEAPGDEELGSRYVVVPARQRALPHRPVAARPDHRAVAHARAGAAHRRRDQSDGTGPSQITRTARAKSITIIGNVAPGYAEGDIVAALEQGRSRS